MTVSLRRILRLFLRKEEEDIVPLLIVLIAIMMLKEIQQASISSRLQRTSSGETGSAIS